MRVCVDQQVTHRRERRQRVAVVMELGVRESVGHPHSHTPTRLHAYTRLIHLRLPCKPFAAIVRIKSAGLSRPFTKPTSLGFFFGLLRFLTLNQLTAFHEYTRRLIILCEARGEGFRENLISTKGVQFFRVQIKYCLFIINWYTLK